VSVYVSDSEINVNIPLYDEENVSSDKEENDSDKVSKAYGQSQALSNYFLRSLASLAQMLIQKTAATRGNEMVCAPEIPEIIVRYRKRYAQKDLGKRLDLKVRSRMLYWNETSRNKTVNLLAKFCYKIFTRNRITKS
jgi:predicted transcriptional regulator